MDAEVIGPTSESLFLARYQTGERKFSGLAIVSDGSRALENVSLDGIELVDCFLTVSLRGTSLRNAVVHSNVKTCDFTGADLRGADFRGAALCSTTFKGAKMEGAAFEGAFFHSYDLTAGELPNW